MKRGEVWVAHLKPRSGSEQRGTRPVIVVSHDGFNTTPGWRSIIVVPVSTSPAQGQRGPTVVGLPKAAGGLRQESVALCHQTTTLDRAKLSQCLGTLNQDLLRQLEDGIRIAVGLLPL
ncbi:MAG: type II toxin-antitoxin system PemK/MazF family toxin [Acidobacteriota bacterium]